MHIRYVDPERRAAHAARIRASMAQPAPKPPRVVRVSLMQRIIAWLKG